jgi:hypothetical protein
VGSFHWLGEQVKGVFAHIEYAWNALMYSMWKKIAEMPVIGSALGWFREGVELSDVTYDARKKIDQTNKAAEQAYKNAYNKYSLAEYNRTGNIDVLDPEYAYRLEKQGLLNYQKSNSNLDDDGFNWNRDWASGISTSLDSIDKNTSKIAQTLEEDLRYLVDINERKAIDRVANTRIQIDIGGISNTISSLSDLSMVGDYITEQLRMSVEAGAGGV